VSGEAMRTATAVDGGLPADVGRPAGAVLTIDLGAIRANYRKLRGLIGNAACGAVLKANAYGLGAERVAATLAAEGCTSFFTAHLSEGLSLRDTLGPDPVVIVLNGLHPGAEPDCAAAGLVPVLNSIEQLKAWRDQARRLGRILPAAIQVDSGMARLGMAPQEVETVRADPLAFEGLAVKLVMSHLARAEEPDASSNERQRAAFLRLAAGLPPAPRSLANSSGIFLGAPFHFDLARPGVALYGVNPTPDLPNPMRAAIRMHARVIQVRDVEPGDGIGYGHATVAARRLRAATISLGYADGWHRRAETAAFLDGVRLPFLGRVSMDSIVLDVTALGDRPLPPGTLVELIGDHQTVDDVGTAAGTIGYEILTSLGSRFHRIFIDDTPEQAGKVP
jgi:alanine racemase